MLMEIFFLFYLKETSSHFHEINCLLVYYGIVICIWILPVRFIFPFVCINVFVLIKNFFYHNFLQIVFYIYQKKILTILLKEYFSSTLLKKFIFQLYGVKHSIIAENLFPFNWSKISFKFTNIHSFHFVDK